MKNSVLCYLEETVRRFPDKVAITDSNGDITFSEWRSRGLCVAEEIQKRKSDINSFPIFVYLPKSSLALIAFVGVLYSGNYYTPTDVKFPFEKAKSIIDELQPQVIITNHECAKKLLDGGIEPELMMYIDDVDMARKNIDSRKYLEAIVDIDLAYVLFTSGSTGVPKGVSITQRSIMDYIDWLCDEFEVTENEIIGNQAPFYFDNSVLDIYVCMCTGAHLYIVPEIYYAFPAKLLEYIKTKNINFVFWVPSVLIAVANSGLLERIDVTCIKKVLFAGEVMPNKHLNYWRSYIPAEIYANLYGPTEITVDCIYYIVNRVFADDEPLPIGKACQNTQILLLNEKNELIVEQDKIGELCVRGTGVSVGYYKNKDKTQVAFVQNPLHNNYRDLIYRTGDLAHYNEYGELMFDGRKDYQIKHMGYRIELGEIETAILGIDGVENACCVYNDRDSEIIAACKLEKNLKEVQIRKILASILPKYMVPTRYYMMEQLPLNDNGKIDRKLLKSIIMEETVNE